MEFLNRLVRPDYENAAWDLREHATSIAVNHDDHQFSQGINLELHRIVAERVFLRTGYIHSYLNHLAIDQKPTAGVSMASWKFDQAMDEHFTSRPGIDKGVGAQIYRAAIAKYHVQEVEVVAAKFLTSLTGKLFEASHMKEMPPIVGFVARELRDCLLFTKRKTANLKNR